MPIHELQIRNLYIGMKFVDWHNTMTIKELRQLSETELKRILAESREKLRELRFKSARREIKNVREGREVKKTIARILTLAKK